MNLDFDLYRKNTPLMKDKWLESLKKSFYSQYAPMWNVIIGDRITEDDYRFVKKFEQDLYENRSPSSSEPNDRILKYIRGLRFHSIFYYDRLNKISLPSDFQEILPMTRDDLQNRITEILPIVSNLDRMVVNPTSGTTGVPILAPSHPKTIGCYVPLIEYSLARHGVKTIHHYNETTAIQLCNQNKTIVYITPHSLAEGAKFAKINLTKSDWKSQDHINQFIKDEEPIFLSGDPYSFEGALEMNLQYQPKAIHSTALDLSESLRIKLKEHFQCPVINFYSLNETGPIAYSCPNHPEQMHLISNDIYIEIIDETGKPASLGEIVVTGGRNPYLPLLRYRTGDWGELDHSPCDCGEVTARLKLLKGRKPIFFTDTQGNKVNPVDISRILRMESNILNHSFVQKKNGSYEIKVRWYNVPRKENTEELVSKFNLLFGNDAKITLMELPISNGKKHKMFINENLNEI